MNRRYFINILATQDLKKIADYFTARGGFLRRFDLRVQGFHSRKR